MNSTSNNNDSSSDQPVSASVPFLGRSLFFSHRPHTPKKAVHNLWINISLLIYYFLPLLFLHFSSGAHLHTHPGTAVYVYCILSGSAASQNWTTDLTFVLDNTTVGVFLKQPSNDSSSDDFGQLVFSTTGLTNSTHILTIQSGLNSETWSAYTRVNSSERYYGVSIGDV